MPSKSTILLIVILLVLVVITGWNYIVRPFGQSDSTETAQTSPTPSPLVDGVTSRLVSLSPEQKVSLLLAFPFSLSPQASYSGQLAWIEGRQPGTVTIFGSAVSQEQVIQLREELAGLYAAGSTPLLAVDHEGGRVQRLNGENFTTLPSWRSLCSLPASQSAVLLRTSFSELKTAGVDMVLAPSVEVASSHAVLRDRVCNGDSEVVVERSLQYIEEATRADLLPVIKHFPGISGTTRDLHFNFDRVTITPEDALVFRYILDRHPSIGVMMSPVGVSNQYPDVPCTLSIECVRELVTNYTQVLVVSDGLEMAATRYLPDGTQATLSDVAIRAVRAGNQVLVFGPSVTNEDLDQVVADIASLYQSDEDFKETVDQAVIKLLQYKAERDQN